MEGLSVGRIVHYYNPELRDGARAAIIVRVWGDTGTVNLHVFKDGANDPASVPDWPTSVQHISQFPDPANQPRTYWDWPARA